MARWHATVCIFLLGSVGLCQAASDPPPSDPRLTPVVLAYRKARPAVVNISTETLVGVRFGLFGEDPFQDIFPSPLLRRVPVESLGSGFIISPKGYIVTNAHVVRQAEKITVTLAGKSEYQAKAISSDPDHDLGVLKIDPPAGSELPCLPLGRSDDLMVGETVIAIGNPLGYSNSLTTGVISATDRTLTFPRGVKIPGLIQTDAPINPGNSGGPLLNIKGELIGVNTAIRADAQNIGFAIPVDRLAEELVSLLDAEKLNRAVFGAAVAQRHGSAGDELVVTEVRKGTPADGVLQVGDRIIALNGQPMRQITDYACAMAGVAPNTTAAITCIRDGREMSIHIAIKAKPRPDGGALAWQLFGLRLSELTPQSVKDLRLPVNHGLLVVGIEEGSPAEKLGIELKDIVFQVGRLYVTDLESLGVILEAVKPGQELQVGIVRGNVRAWAPMVARSGGAAGG